MCMCIYIYIYMIMSIYIQMIDCTGDGQRDREFTKGDLVKGGLAIMI